jgi:5'-nucleotidase
MVYPVENGALRELCKETEIFELLERVPAGTFDAVVAGHTHQVVLGTFHGIPILQPPAKGKGVAWASLSRPTQTLEADVHDLLHVNEAVGEDERGVRALLAPYRRGVAKRANQPLGVIVLGEFTRDFHRENALGNFMADQLRAATGANVAMINNGGLRANLPTGPLTYGRVYDVVPFDNRIATVTVTGKQLADAVALGVSGRFEGYSWSNVRAVITGGKVSSLFIGGEPVDLARPYTVTISDFLAGGGSGFAELGWPTATIEFARPPMRDLIVTAIERAAVATPRIDPTGSFDPAAPRLTIQR